MECQRGLVHVAQVVAMLKGTGPLISRLLKEVSRHEPFFFELRKVIKEFFLHSLLGIYPGSPSRLFFEGFFCKDYCFSRDLFHQQFKGTILFMVGLTSRVLAILAHLR